MWLYVVSVNCHSLLKVLKTRVLNLGPLYVYNSAGIPNNKNLCSMFSMTTYAD